MNCFQIKNALNAFNEYAQMNSSEILIMNIAVQSLGYYEFDFAQCYLRIFIIYTTMELYKELNEYCRPTGDIIVYSNPFLETFLGKTILQQMIFQKNVFNDNVIFYDNLCLTTIRKNDSLMNDFPKKCLQ